LDAFKFSRHGHEIIQEGYDKVRSPFSNGLNLELCTNGHSIKYYGSAFKIPIMERWLVIVTGPKMIEDIRRASDETMSFDDAAAEVR